MGAEGLEIDPRFGIIIVRWRDQYMNMERYVLNYNLSMGRPVLRDWMVLEAAININLDLDTAMGGFPGLFCD